MSRRLLQLEIRSQDSPSIADVLVVERVHRVKTFAQHATLGVLEVVYKNSQEDWLLFLIFGPQCRFIILRANFSATGCQQILFSTQAGPWDHPESAKKACKRTLYRLEQRHLRWTMCGIIKQSISPPTFSTCKTLLRNCETDIKDVRRKHIRSPFSYRVASSGKGV